MRIDGNYQVYNFWGNGIPLRCFRREARASRFSINETNQNLWIPNKHLHENGDLKLGENIDYVIVQARSQIKHSGLFSDRFFKPSVKFLAKDPTTESGYEEINLYPQMVGRMDRGQNG